MHTATEFRLEARPRLPEALERLDTLANDLFYSWDHGVRSLFARIDLRLWQKVEHNPKLFLRRVAQARLDQASEDRAFLAEYRRVLSAYDAYLESEPGTEVLEALNPEDSLVAYFCAEFGFHESFPIYSGALAYWLVTIARRPVTWGCPLSPSGYCISRAISFRPLMPRGTRLPVISAILAMSCQSRR